MIVFTHCFLFFMFSTMINKPVVDEVASNFVAVVETLTVFFIPYLLGFISASYSGLWLWIALRKASPAPNHELDTTSSGESQESQESRGKKRHIGLATAFLIILCILEFGLIFKKFLPVKQTLVVLRGMLYIWLFLVTIAFINGVFGASRQAVHRKPNGGYLIHTHKCHVNKENAGLIFLASFMVVLGLLTTGNIISVGVVTTAVVHTSSGSKFGKVRLQKMIKCYVLILIAIAAIVISLSRANYFKQIDYDNVSQIYSDWLFVLSSPTVMCSALSGGLISRMLRFDYQRHLDDPTGGQDMDLVTVPAPINTGVNKKNDLGEGILIPKWTPRAFLKPYFTVAIVTWSIIKATIIVLHPGVGYSMSNPSLMCAVALLLEFPIIAVVLSLFAAIRKEAKAFWDYDETWKLSPTEGGISLKSDDIVL